MVNQYIDKVGVEIEAATDLRPDINGTEIHYDGTVLSNDGWDQELEYVTDPFEDIEELMDRVRVIYRYVREVNDSMGLHIHTSLTDEQYHYFLAEMKFIKVFNTILRESDLYEEYRRLRQRDEHNDYAKKIEQKSKIKKMILGMNQYRYSRINWVAKKDHGTLEFRIFPAVNTAEDVRRAIDIVVEAITVYLDNQLYTDSYEVKELEKEEELEVHYV